MDIIDSVIGAGESALSAIGGGLSALSNVFEILTSPNTWLRVFYVLFGTLLVFGALRYGHS